MISVIVPVYNVEKYLDRCLESIVNQTYANLEIILIDDGSPDRCPQMCDEWAQKDARIRVVHKQNEGQGIARNVGLDSASGEWISFIDSDDFIDLKTYETCLKQLRKHNADICYFGMNGLSAGGVFRQSKPRFPEIIPNSISRETLVPLCFGRFPSDQFAIGSACIGLYRKGFIEEHHIRFPKEKGIVSEDFVFSADVCAAAPAVTFVREGLYCYCENLTSFTHRYLPDRFEKSVAFHENRKQEIKRLNLGTETQIRSEMRYWIMILAAVKNDVYSDVLTFTDKIKRLRKIINHPFSREANNKNVRKHMNKKKLLFLLMFKIRSALGVYLLVKLQVLSRVMRKLVHRQDKNSAVRQ